MSKQYTQAVATFPTKKNSRNKVAQSMRDNMKLNSINHYLGGTSTMTPFENKFKGTDATFVRYERMKALVPSGYEKVEFNQKGVNIPNGKRLFVNEDFFESFFDIYGKVQGNENHLWLDFCGLPTESLMDCINYTFFHKDSDIKFKSIYFTFFLNPRNCKEAKELFKNDNTLEERANTLLAEFKKMANAEEFTFEVFDTYINGISPMAVLKIERRENIEDMAKTTSVENYVRLHKRGFTNKQIAVFWKAGIMQVAGFAAQAKRKKLI